MTRDVRGDARPADGPDAPAPPTGGRAMTGPTTRDELPLLLTADEAAALLRTTRKAVYAMAERAALPGAVRIGRRLLVHRDDLLRWLDERRAPSPGRTRR
ncbi:helix-turn-helix domain-containing protein [Sorangium sp. So ce291]|uniref:helix-turn-helix domain-containing protein n=1 Tax=Sorangium sp. So ce291 TaxID=3133294 RepID=UPI003F62FAFD